MNQLDELLLYFVALDKTDRDHVLEKARFMAAMAAREKQGSTVLTLIAGGAEGIRLPVKRRANPKKSILKIVVTGRSK